MTLFVELDPAIHGGSYGAGGVPVPIDEKKDRALAAVARTRDDILDIQVSFLGSV